MQHSHRQQRADQTAAIGNDLVSTSQLRALASMAPTTALATLSDEELAAMARHLLPDMAGELLGHRLAALAGSAEVAPARHRFANGLTRILAGRAGVTVKAGSIA
ncbi:hypothetical protein [Phaeobacter gallaeciensis]|uniref:Uncharacterized protein n=1 Tax=Phaeobacter gallaeciensis TaxID=60890 RepID=A0AAC9Z9A0_9RHOB|nr:hypothetical protein [Phaeobacter gallaeciensis]AHD09508.1 hypothetical protein Gal_01752 [Phaeobacter gallaeciensis DSM 26640]ATE92773.1 hypothetical protein PhaeoP11_01745 [Phaeobacter gallaeciensis]ATE97405.1 hypothetical protein PhaeoP73_02101 [Phaeobacter gallaeciensis]ATF01438.1 hypothetical protein PhaeoP75_01795 [Phaeobacter gallaeciensis]ATF05818.1 hypothetical protein PhaeoP63_01743 [Phaeobacter gallaeciensis]